jgi:decaprenyl-phosphate phosphoribosyltransferase
MSETLERPVSRLPAPIRALRPRQWVKNFLVLLAPLAAGWLFRPEVLRGVALAFVAFCLVSSAVYLLNDVRDVEEDRLHPKKRFRPIAAGELSVPVAAVMAVVLGLGGLGLGYLVDPGLAITLGVYVVIQVLYSTVLKHLPVIDLAVVSSGFLLRAIAGGVAVGVPLSQWFLLVASFGSLFMVAGKRYSELISVGAEAGTRRSLDRYSASYLRFVWILAAVLVVTSYSLWAFENRGSPPLGVPWTAISIAPFTLGMLQYALEVDAGQAGEPEDVVLHDHVLQGLGVIWLATISIAVFA